VEFVPPTEGQRLAAIGQTSQLPAMLRRAFEPGEAFEAMWQPGPGDWLANHHEDGQTFWQFVRLSASRPDGARRVLYLQPLGEFGGAAPSLEQLLRFSAAFFMLETRLLPVQPPGSITSRRNPWTGQPQLLTIDILRQLRLRLPQDAFALVGITMTDLYPEPGWNFVFGQASPSGRVGVYSFARYDPRFYGEARTPESDRLMLRRSCKVLAHETGHLFGIMHCVWFRCLMNGSNHLAEADARPMHLCPVDLRKLQAAVGFDVVERYRRLRDFHRQAGVEDEVLWLERRLQWITG